MSREIKFRCWDIENKRWLDINEIVNDWGNTPWMDSMCVSGDTTFELRDSGKSLVWMQYTGLKDKNGRDAYEGDVVEWWDKTLNTSFREVVEWSDGGMHAGFTIGRYHAIRGFLVIGNVYEHPEMLEAA